MNTVKIDQVAGRLPDLIATLAPGEEILIVDGETALARLTAATKTDQMNLSMRAIVEEEETDDAANEFARYMT